MTTTNKLQSVPKSDLSGADLFRLWSQKFGADVALSLTNLKDWLTDNMTLGALTTQYAAPSATGFSVTIAAADTWLVLTPVAGYAAGTLVLPAGTDKAEILVNCTQAVTTLTITPATGETVTGAPTSLSANDSFRLRFDGVTSVWYKVG